MAHRSPADRVALLLVRAWRETDELSGFRARISVVDDLTGGGAIDQRATASADELCEIVCEWARTVGQGRSDD